MFIIGDRREKKEGRDIGGETYKRWRERDRENRQRGRGLEEKQRGRDRGEQTEGNRHGKRHRRRDIQHMERKRQRGTIREKETERRDGRGIDIWEETEGKRQRGKT